MDIQQIVSDLKQERDRIDSAIRALEGTGKSGRGPGRPPGSGASKGKKRRTMSPAARKRISEMMKLRWAERKRKAKAKA
ncbi:MAG TPA: hypothetical protein VIH91_05430 [Terriglobales bacterium]